MSLQKYLNKSTNKFPQKIGKGIPSEWMPVGTVNITQGSLWAGDPYVCNEEDGFIVNVPNGKYTIEAQGFDFEGYRVIGRARARLTLESDFTHCKKAGKTGTDSAIIAICDMKALDIAIAGDDDGFQEKIMNINYKQFGRIDFRMDDDIELVYVQSGFGDGVGQVYKLLEGDTCVGIELDFLPEENISEIEED